MRDRNVVLGVRMTPDEREMLRALEVLTGETSGVLVRRWVREHHAALAAEPKKTRKK
jgi:hypothetical protein